MPTARTLAVSLIVLALALPTTLAGISPVGPITNGGFEAPVMPGPVHETVAVEPLTECYGIGHQANYGTDSVQYEVLDNQSASGAVNESQEDDTANDLFGPDTCYWSNEEGKDYVWLQPVEDENSPVHWSYNPDHMVVDWGYFHDDDPFDREVRVKADTTYSHNFWQAYPSPFQGFTANADHLEFEVEDGEIPSPARVQISLSTFPFNQDAEAIAYDCFLTFGSDVLTPDANGLVQVDPVDARFTEGHTADCAHLKAEWDAGDDDVKRNVLGSARIIQVSFWAFNAGTEDVVLDNVAYPGATTIAEELANDATNQ